MKTRITIAGALAVVAIALAGCGDSGGDGRGGLSTIIDGNATCAEHVTPGTTGTPVGHSASVDELKFVIDPAARPQRVRSGALKGMWMWKAPVSLTAERNAIIAIDPEQKSGARLQYDPLDREVNFSGLAQTVRFAACFDSQLKPEGEKITPMTGWAGAIVTREPGICLRTRVVSERNNKGTDLHLPLGREC